MKIGSPSKEIHATVASIRPLGRLACSVITCCLLLLVLGCKREVAPGSSAEVERRDKGLDPMVLSLTEGHENLRWFFREDTAEHAFESLFSDIRMELDSLIDKDSKPGFWLSGVHLNRKGTGMLAMNGDCDEPASVLIVRHHREKPEITIRKAPIWDKVMVGDKVFARRCERSIFVLGDGDGVSEIQISFSIYASPASEIGDTRKFLGDSPGCYMYALNGDYLINPRWKNNDYGVLRLTHYNPQKQGLAKYGKEMTRVDAELLSTTWFRKGAFDLPEPAKRHLLAIMDRVTSYGINEPEITTYKDLLRTEPLQLARPAVSKP